MRKIDIYKNHPCLNADDYGTNINLLGNVLIYILPVQDNFTLWNQKGIDEFVYSLNDSVNTMKNASAQLNKNVNFVVKIDDHIIQFYDLINNDLENQQQGQIFLDGLINYIRQYKRMDIKVFIETLKHQYKVDSVILMFALNKTFRSFCFQANETTSNLAEFVCIGRDQFLQYRQSYFLHEIFHLYGAIDYYTTPQLQQLALKYFPNSIMNNAYGSELLIDDLLRNHANFFEELCGNIIDNIDSESYDYYNNTSDKSTFKANVNSFIACINADEDEDNVSMPTPTTFLFDRTENGKAYLLDNRYCTEVFFNYTIDVDGDDAFSKGYFLRDSWNYEGKFSDERK